MSCASTPIMAMTQSAMNVPGSHPESHIRVAVGTPESTAEGQSSRTISQLSAEELQSDFHSMGDDLVRLEDLAHDLGRAADSQVSLPDPDACDPEPRAVDDARALHEASSFQRTRQRLPALLITYAIEMVVAFVISNFTNTFKRYPLLISFQPILSAISGNFGLQASTTNTRALAVGLVGTKHSEILASVGSEIATGAFAGTAMALVAGITAFCWYASGDGHTQAGAWAFAAAICIGQFVSIMSAAMTGSAAPLLSKRCGMDPASTAGPFETAFQDIVGSTALLALSACILSTFGDYAGECPGGSLTGCFELCRAMGGLNITAEQWSCIHSCSAMVDEGIC